jgi:hypothetical protein
MKKPLTDGACVNILHIYPRGVRYSTNGKESSMIRFDTFKRKTYQKWFLHAALAVLILSPFIGAALVSADTGNGDEHGKPLEVVLQEIREKYGIGPNEAINPRKLSDAELEEVGEAVMSIMYPDPRQHEIMDDMMGGEGSRSLARMHRRMGYNYLSGNGYWMMGGGRRGMMGGMM